jgi:hypothetical protein
MEVIAGGPKGLRIGMVQFMRLRRGGLWAKARFGAGGARAAGFRFWGWAKMIDNLELPRTSMCHTANNIKSPMGSVGTRYVAHYVERGGVQGTRPGTKGRNETFQILKKSVSFYWVLLALFKVAASGRLICSVRPCKTVHGNTKYQALPPVRRMDPAGPCAPDGRRRCQNSENTKNTLSGLGTR